ncbi:tRNA (guanosine(37)-N1)-methyltransferase TrmD, partial [Candidatus Roizmanbacteria bacterium CG17_big_fil_post_rev_8_21_14_2_50_39_7]
MKITIVTLFPKMIEGFIQNSIIKRAQTKGAVE